MDVILGILVDMAIVLLTLGMVALTTSWALLHKFKPGAVILTGTITVGFFTLASYILPQLSHPADMFSQLSQYFDQAHFEADWKASLDAVSKWGLNPDKSMPPKDLYQKYFYFALPAWEAIRCLLWGLLAYYVVSSFLSRITSRVPKATAFREWIVPEPLIFGLIAGASLKLFARENGILDILADNLLVFFTGLYTIGGFSIVSFFLYKWRLPRMIRVMGYFAIVVIATIFSICGLGILDVWFDFRKLKAPPSEAA
ncbi:MAG TPA: DUF2232 domain-containing protein [bacterium]|nr:DUF2232 domain-containing protein [bacterium]